jgi:hypothetical protein
VYNREAGAEWFNLTLTESPRLCSAYRLAGWLMGQAVNNRCDLDVRFPRYSLPDSARHLIHMRFNHAFEPSFLHLHAMSGLLYSARHVIDMRFDPHFLIFSYMA